MTKQQVVSRSGAKEIIDISKITERIDKVIDLCGQANRLDSFDIVKHITGSVTDGITTRELDDLVSQTCMSASIDDYGWAIVGARIAISNHRRSCKWTFSEGIDMLYKDNLVTKELHAIVFKDPAFWDKVVEDAAPRDFLIDCFGFKTLEKSYLLRTRDGTIIETISAMWLRVSLGIWGYNRDDVIDTFDMLSTKKATHATPTLFNSGTPSGYFASCYLLGMDDSVEGIFDCLKKCAVISKRAGGIGVHCSNVRASDSYIKGTGGRTSGIVPMMRVFNNAALFVNQCFVPGTTVFTDSGPKRIEAIVALKDRVLTHDGTFKPVRELFKREINEPMYRFKGLCFDGMTQCTGVHEIGVIHFEGIANNTDALEATRAFKGPVEITYKPAADLCNGDFLMFRVPEEPETPVDINFDTMCTIVDRFRESGLYSEKLATASQASLTEFLEEWLEVHRRFENDLSFAFVLNRKSAEAMRYLLLRKGQLCEIQHCSGNDLVKAPATTGTAGTDDVYKFVFPRNDFFDELLGRGKSEGNPFFSIGEYLAVPFTQLSVTTDNYKGPVYDLNVEGNHNYTTSNGIVHNSGKRMGSVAMYIEPWHADIFSFLEAMNQHGTESVLARDIYYGLWVCDAFMRAVADDSPWYLMSPDDCPGLTDVHGKEFEALYSKYIDEGKYRSKIKARDVWNVILRCQVERGMPYMTNKDAVNAKTNQANIGTIKSSNLCNEIMEVSGADTTAVCNLASIRLASFVEKRSVPEGMFTVITPPGNKQCEWCDLVKVFLSDMGISFSEVKSDDLEANAASAMKTFPRVLDGEGNLVGGFDDTVAKYAPRFDWESFRTTVMQVVRNLDRVIDVTEYPTDCARRSNFDTRPLGIGVQGLADTFAMMWIVYDSERGEAMNKLIFERMYKYALEQSVLLAKEKGPYPKYEGSPASQGKLQMDLWNVVPQDADWSSIREGVAAHGLRNSLLVALMPTASTAQILGSTESFEPFGCCFYSRHTLSGSFVVANAYLLKILESLGLWTDEMKERIMFNRGSVATIRSVPSYVRAMFKTSWEVSKSRMIKMSADRGAFVCQGQSLNFYVSDKNVKGTLHKIHMRSWELGLKSMSYYIRTKPAVDAQMFTLNPDRERLFLEEQAKYAGTDNECISCSS